MVKERLAGSRIREKRLDRGLRQAAVAEAVGISPSYLNLIEHNRRRIGGKLLSDIARVLEVDPARLTEGVSAETLDQLRAAAGMLGADVELAQAEEMAARYPGWSALTVAQARRIGTLQQQLQVLTDRMAHDPQLAGALHEVISAVSAIRSSSSILVGSEQLDDDWRRRFHENIHNDSLRLAASSEALIAYLDAPGNEADQISLPIEQVESYLGQTSFHLAALEDATATPDDVVEQSGLSGAAKTLLAQFAAQYGDDAARLPLAPFAQASKELDFDPAALAQRFGAPFGLVLRRLASLPVRQGHPPLGLVVCDAAGVVTLMKTVPGFAVPRAGGACPLWPLFAALGRPGQPLRLDVALPGANAPRFLCYAIAEAQPAIRFDIPPMVQSTMLVLPDPPAPQASPLPVGVSCRICPRANCVNRREPALAGL